VWYILCVVAWSPVKTKIIKQKSNIFKIDSVVSIKLSTEPQERPSKIELLTISSVFGIVLLVNVYWWELTGLLLFLLPYHYDDGTLGNKSVFTKSLKKERKRATDDWYCISKIFPQAPQFIRNSRPQWSF